MSIPEFTTKRLFLRGLRLSDAKSYEKHFADYEIIQYLNSTVPWPYPQGGVKDFFKNIILPKQGVDRWAWGIFLKEDLTECIGSISLRRKGCPGNRGFWLGKKYHGKGLMTEAVFPVLNYGFKELRFKRMIFDNAVQNKASRRIKEKTGCRYIERRPHQFANPKYTENEIWELTKEQWLDFCRRQEKDLS